MLNRTRVIIGTSLALLTMAGGALFIANEVSANTTLAAANEMTTLRVNAPKTVLHSVALPLAETSDEADMEAEDAYDWFTIAANQLGLSEDELFMALEEGQSIADLAAAHGVDSQAIADALIAAETEFISSLLAEGEITQEEADEWLAELPTDAAAFVNESALFDELFFDGVDWFQIAADAIGVDVNSLFEAESIAAVATAQGVDVQTVIDAIVTAENAFIDGLVTEGEISEEEAAEWKAENAEYIAEFVNETFVFEDIFFDGVDWLQIAADTIGVGIEALFEAESIAAVATAQGVEVQTVIDAIITADNAFIDGLVAEGEISAEEAAEWKVENADYVAEFVNESFDFDGGFYFEGVDWLQVAADTLGVDVDTLLEAESIAAVAEAQGVDVQTVTDAILAAENAFIDELVASGELTEEEAAEWKAENVEFVNEFLTTGFEFFDMECDEGHVHETDEAPESDA